MMVNPASLEADPAEGRVHAPRQQGSKSSVRSKEQARKGHAARKLKRALNAKNLGGNVALEAKPLGGAEVDFTAAIIPGLMVMTAILHKLVKHSKFVMTAIRQLKKTSAIALHAVVFGVHEAPCSTGRSNKGQLQQQRVT